MQQRQEIARQEQIKLLAAEADARWEAKPSLMDAPDQEQGRPAVPLNTERIALGGTLEQQLPRQEHNAVDASIKVTADQGVPSPEPGNDGSNVPKQDTKPGKRAPTGPSEGWQPQAWTPGSSRR